MTIAAVPALGVHDEVGAPATAPAMTSSEPFSARMAESLQALNQDLLATQSDLQGLAVGEAPNLHEVMLRMEEGRLGLQLMLQVRNRVLESYQDVMRMQV